MYEPPEISSVEEILVYCFTAPVDGIKFITGFIPVIDLLGSGLAIVSFMLLALYLFIRLGPAAFLGGTKSNRKMGFFLVDAIIDFIPEIDDLLPTLTPLAWNSFACVKDERKAHLAKKEAANENARRPRLSRAA